TSTPWPRCCSSLASRKRPSSPRKRPSPSTPSAAITANSSNASRPATPRPSDRRKRNEPRNTRTTRKKTKKSFHHGIHRIHGTRGKKTAKKARGQKRSTIRLLPGDPYFFGLLPCLSVYSVVKNSSFSMPEQELLAVEQGPLDVFPGLALVSGLLD